MLLQRRFVFFFPSRQQTLGKVHNPFFKLYRHFLHTSILLFFSIFSLSLYFPFPANKLNLDKDLQPETSCLPTKLTLGLHENHLFNLEYGGATKKSLPHHLTIGSNNFWCFGFDINAFRLALISNVKAGAFWDRSKFGLKGGNIQLQSFCTAGISTRYVWLKSNY